MRRHAAIIAAGFVSFLIASIAVGQYAISWSTVDGGGAMSSTGGTYSLAGTIGQPDASSFSTPISGGPYTLVGGFWSFDSAVPSCALAGDMDLNGLRNGSDIQGFIRCLLNVNGTNCACADISGNGTVGPEDLAGFVALLLLP